MKKKEFPKYFHREEPVSGRMRNTALLHCYTILRFTLFTLFPIIATASDTITATQSISNNQTIVSSGDIFELGFFSPGNTKKWYMGIWYKNFPDKTVVWVANRDNPVTNSSAVLKIADDGNLVILDEAANIVWSSNQSNQTKAVNNPVAQLLDSGNFVVREEIDTNPKNYLWQSFDQPTDTLLPEMKLGWDLKTGLNRYLTAWKSTDDPSSGDYSFKLDPHGFPEMFLWQGQVRVCRSGPWNGIGFSGVPEMESNYIFNYSFISNQDELYYSFTLKNKSLVSRLIVNTSGLLQRSTWIETSKVWNLFWSYPEDQCDDYKKCGAYGICDANASPVCKCVKGFEPKNQQAWYLRDGSGGCVRKEELDCVKDGFLKLKNMKLPESSSAFVDKSMSRKDCERACRNNCSCTAYANSDIAGGGTGCVIWSGELVDLRAYEASGQDLYVRLAASQLGSKSKISNLVIIAIVVAGTIFLSVSIRLLWRFKSKLEGGESQSRRLWADFSRSDDIVEEGKQENGPELPLFNFNFVAVSTNNFSEENKLGQGGFGPVYKGNLPGGQEIAVKRLSRKSGQGVDEFKNEIILIAKLQHRNLVGLLGCCIEGEEKMLLYEYMPNRSLDCFLFDSTEQTQLDWRKRFTIIEGIARGLLYLHRDSRLKIIHRDLKASNILLDEEMNPKISDFGLARIFGGNQNQANTNRVVGTYGYMSPEYGMRGIFSEKSDVFSFGVLLLEIVSGKKNSSFCCHEQHLTLLGYAWKLWNECRGLDFMDQALADSFSTLEVMRCIHVGLLCVQDRAMDRPTMSAIVFMLSSETDRPQPKQPIFTFENVLENSDLQPQCNNTCSVNDVTVSMIKGR